VHERLLSNWVSGHIFLASNDPSTCDQFIIDVVAPLVRESMARGFLGLYFFARNDRHIRLRMQPTPMSEEALEVLLERYVADRSPRDLLSAPVGPLSRYARRSCRDALVWIPYVRELDLYGGPGGMAVAEVFFRDSTDFSLRLLERIGSGLDREAMGLAAMVTILGSMTRDNTRLMCACRMVVERNAPPSLAPVLKRGFARQAEALTQQVSECWAANTGGWLPEPLDACAEAALRARRSLDQLVVARELVGPTGIPLRDIDDAIQTLAPRYVHMACNQLGISVLSEGCLGYAMLQVLGNSRCHHSAE
jgi:thiopeptide-type bacteriocin biosynthesis protein